MVVLVFSQEKNNTSRTIDDQTFHQSDLPGYSFKDHDQRTKWIVVWMFMGTNYIMFLLNCDQFLLIFCALTRAFPQISGYVGMGARDHPRPMLVPSN